MASVIKSLAFQGLSSEASQVAGEIEGKKIYLRTIGVTLSLGNVEEPKGNVLGVEVIAKHAGLPEPIRFTAVGFGDNLEAAAISAAQQWFQVVFPVLHARSSDHPTTGVGVAKISARNRSSGERFEWRVFVGPVRVITEGAAEPESSPRGDIMHTLKHEITGVAASSRPFWLDAYVAVRADGTPLADCRLVNEAWPEATERLASAASDLLDTTGGFHSWRQFLYFDPVIVPDAIERSWWRRFGSPGGK